MISRRWAIVKLSGIAISPLFGSCACAATTGSSSNSSRIGDEIASIAKELAAALKGSSQYSAYGADAGLEHRDPGNMRRNLFEQLHPLACLRRLRNVETGDVAARSR